MQRWREIHLYLGCLFAPVLIFFAVSGSWQLYRWNDSTKDRSYIAPKPLALFSAIHKNSHLPGKRESDYTPLRTFMFLAAAGLVLTAMLGIVMAFRFAGSVTAPLLCLFAGMAIPAAILFLYG